MSEELKCVEVIKDLLIDIQLKLDERDLQRIDYALTKLIKEVKVLILEDLNVTTSGDQFLLGVAGLYRSLNNLKVEINVISDIEKQTVKLLDKLTEERNRQYLDYKRYLEFKDKYESKASE